MTTTDTLQEAAQSLLQPDPSPQEAPVDTAPQEDAPVEEEEREEDTAEAEAEEPEAQDDAAEYDASDDEDDFSDETDGDEQPQVFTVKVNGEQREVTLDDLKQSYSGQEYIQKGMQEAAAKRKEAEAMQAQIQERENQLWQMYQQAQQGGFKAPPKEPDASLIDSDPIGYMQDRARYDQEMAEFQQQQQQVQQMYQQRQQAEAQARDAFLQEQRQKLTTLVPELGDAEKAPEFQRKIAQTASEAYGLTAEELGQVVDARHVQILADAMRWREMQSGKGKKEQPKPVKNVKPAGRRKPSQKLESQKRLERARKTGSIEDAAAALLDPKIR